MNWLVMLLDFVVTVVAPLVGWFKRFVRPEDPPDVRRFTLGCCGGVALLSAVLFVLFSVL